MRNVRALVVIALASGMLGVAQADTLQMGGADKSARFNEAGKPSRGMSQARVEAEYGVPSTRRGPVGDPPISRWDYPGFAVFFEYDKVIHAVSK
ncbi:MAG: hypothetical protein HKN35_14345 [Woeseia sp.]|nr:hypothetical protein [Woeseia sp.]MBT8097073.1 hypothetical protein [Woeseia sp.]NNE62071.1 hypothetical protein [Woeseia sp.]NNL53682.1 hypothetical protein [Woeseia sp.]